MTKEQSLEKCHNIDAEHASLSLWVFKKRALDFTAQSIEMTDALHAELLTIVIASMARCTEVDDYSLLSETNEASALHVGKDETSFTALQALVDRPSEEHRVKTPRDMKGVAGYLLRVRSGNSVIYCVRRVTDAWQTKKAKTVVNVILRAHQLDLAEDPAFTISRDLDFIVVDNDILILRKRSFESLLNYKIEYTSSFESLQQEAIFVERFASMEPLIAHVGTNAMHLRRMAVVKQKAHYSDNAYMARLRTINHEQGWNIQFDEQGRIVATDATMKAIMQVLLDHRLYSQLSLATYDVPSSAAV